MNLEEHLADVLEELAREVEPSPDALAATRERWRSRERRRRWLAATVATAVIGASNGVALWALNQGAPESGAEHVEHGPRPLERNPPVP